MGGTLKKKKITATNGTILSWYLCCLSIRINLYDCGITYNDHRRKRKMNFESYLVSRFICTDYVGSNLVDCSIFNGELSFIFVRKKYLLKN